MLGITVDKEDADLLVLPWRINDSGYAVSDRNEMRRLHRVIAARVVGRQLDRSEQVDHINGNRIDNRRSNLRLATNQQNAFNKRPLKGYKGVSFHAASGLWRSRIKLDGREICTVYSHTDEEAAYIYDQMALHLFGDYAYLNVL